MHKGIILKEADTLTTDDAEIGDFDTRKIKIQVKDQAPVQKNYNCITKPLYKEIKEYVEDLLNTGWIVPSESGYSSSVEAVRKEN